MSTTTTEDRAERRARDRILPSPNRAASPQRADGAQIVIPNHDPRDAKLRVVPLDASGRRIEKTVTIETLRNLSGVVWAADGKGWYVSVRDSTRGLLFYVDLEGRIRTNLMESMRPSYAVPSPDGRHVAFMDWTVSANVWHVRGL